MYTDDLYQIHNQVLPIDPLHKDLIRDIYGHGERGDGDRRIHVVTYPDDNQETEILYRPRYVYIIRLIPNHIKILMRGVCDERYSPPSSITIRRSRIPTG